MHVAIVCRASAAMASNERGLADREIPASTREFSLCNRYARGCSLALVRSRDGLVLVVAFAQHSGLHDLVGIRALAVPFGAFELGQHVEALDHAAEDRVLAVEVGRRHEREKELRAAG